MEAENIDGSVQKGRARLRKDLANFKTTAADAAAPQDVVVKKRKPGGQPGNRNAFKTGAHTAQVYDVLRSVRRLKRRANAAVAAVNGVIREQKLARRRAAADSKP